MTGNLSRVESFVLETWGNVDAIAINQDKLGLPYRVLPLVNWSSLLLTIDSGTRDRRAVMVGECGGEPARHMWGWWGSGGIGSGALVRNIGPKKDNEQLCLNIKSCKSSVIMDKCLPTGPACGGGAAGLPATNEVFSQPPQSGGEIRTALHNYTWCLTAAVDDSVSVLPCKTPSVPEQQWTFDSKTQHITRVSDGSCLTAPTPMVPAPTGPPISEELAIGRPLQGGKWAIVFLNNRAEAATFRCAEACFSAMGFIDGPPAGATLDDVWGGNLGVVNESGISLVVPPHGGSRLVVLSPRDQQRRGLNTDGEGHTVILLVTPHQYYSRQHRSCC